MTKLSVTDASRKAGVSRQTIYEQIERGDIKRTPAGIEFSELMRIYPNIANPSIVKTAVEQERNAAASSRLAKQSDQQHLKSNTTEAPSDLTEVIPVPSEIEPDISDGIMEKTVQQANTVELLVRELEWNKELLERTNQLMARQLAEQRSLIADQARRLDEKDRFWARQVEIAQSLLPAPAPRKKFLGLF